VNTRQAYEQRLREGLGLTVRPVGVAFVEQPPAGVAPFQGRAPAGCRFWRLAAEGRVFYTVPADHYHCPIGSHTHNLPLPAERAPELQQTLDWMAALGYLAPAEVPGLPRLERSPGAIVYGPLGELPLPPDVVVVVGRPGRLMLLQEAALRAGLGAAAPLLARPTCVALPAALDRGLVLSAGCIGNRIYTDLGDDALYAVLRGTDLAALVAALDTVAAANAALADYHRLRRQQLAAP
jgi:uncharacterized protein (DUF169 family)